LVDCDIISIDCQFTKKIIRKVVDKIKKRVDPIIEPSGTPALIE